MTPDPNAPGDGPLQLIVAALWLFLAGCTFIALALLAHVIVPGGLRDDGQGHGCCAEVSQP